MLKHWPPKGCKLASQIRLYPFFQPFGQYTKPYIKFSIYSSLGQIENIFSISAVTPSVKHLGFTPIVMLDLG